MASATYSLLQTLIKCDPSEPVVALAFKLEEGKYGQLTYMRVYQGTIERGQFLVNLKNGKKIKVRHWDVIVH